MDALETTDAESPFAGRPLLVVEFDPFTRTILSKRLQSAGYEVWEAPDGSKALDIIRRRMPDLVISEWAIPEIDGRELCRRVKEDSQLRGTYFILLTARDRQDDVVSALDSGVDEYLVKPCEARELLARVSAGLRIVRLQRDLEEANDRLNGALRRQDRELQTMAEMQRALLPCSLPQGSSLRFGTYYRPSNECGGDYYDVLPLGEGKYGLVIADVSGHGTPAMVAMSLTRMLVHTLAPGASSPADFLTELNRALAKHLPTDQYVTMFFGLLDVSDHSLVYSSAGQTAPLRLRAGGDGVEPLPKCEGFPLKLIEQATYENTRVPVNPGDRILLFTDGVNETMDADLELFGLERLLDSFRRRRHVGAQACVEGIVEDLDRFAAGHPPSDDLTMLAVDVMDGGPGNSPAPETQ